MLEFLHTVIEGKGMQNILPEHSRFGLSSSERWLNCPGSVNLIESNPKLKKIEEDFTATQGKRAHAIAAKILKREDLTPEECLIDIEEQEAISVYTEYVTKLFNKDKSATLHVEMSVNLSHLHPELYGTADAVIIGKDEVHIIDYKHGIFVDVDYPTQLKMYALQFLGSSQPFKKLYLHFVQPRLPKEFQQKIKVWSITEEELRAVLEEVKKAIQLAYNTTTLNVGKWCDKTFCDARHICPAYTNIMNVMLNDEKKLNTDVKSLSPTQIRQILLNKAKITKIIKNLDAWVKLHVEEDEAFRNTIGFDIKEKSAGLGWVDEARAKNVIKDPDAYKLITPLQVIGLGKVNKEYLEDKELIFQKTSKTLVDIGVHSQHSLEQKT